jgi:hypothetical protein
MLNSKSKAGTKVQQSSKVEVSTSSPNNAKPRVSSSVNHKFVEKRHYYYHGADCYVYETICGFCKKKVGGWSEKQANDEWEKHCC